MQGAGSRPSEVRGPPGAAERGRRGPRGQRGAGRTASNSGGSERFGIFRDSPEPVWNDTKRGSATRWAVIAVLAAMITLFMCLLLIDFTRSERNARRRPSPNATNIPRPPVADGETSNEVSEVADDGRYPHQYHRYATRALRDRNYFGRSLLKEDTQEEDQGVKDEAEAGLSELRDSSYLGRFFKRNDPPVEHGDTLTTSTAGRGEGFHKRNYVDSVITRQNLQENQKDGILTADSSRSPGSSHSTTQPNDGDGGSPGPTTPSPSLANSTLNRTVFGTTHTLATSTLQQRSVASGDQDDNQRRLEPERDRMTGSHELLIQPLENTNASDESPSQEKAETSVVDDDGARSVALPFRAEQQEEESREDWLQMMRAQYLVAARRQMEAQRRNHFPDVGAVPGEQYALPDQVAHQRYVNSQKQLLRLLAQQQQQQQQQSSGSNQRLASSTPSAASVANMNHQYLVVNNKGVLIPNSVNFPEVAKTSNYPQLQSYKNYQKSLGARKNNFQNVFNYLANKGIGYVATALGGLVGDGGSKRPGVAWTNSAVKTHPGKFAGMLHYNPSLDYESHLYSRPEAYVNDPTFAHQMMPTEKVTVESDSPEIPYNGHAYIADPFHPYKPSDLAEINQLMSSSHFDADLIDTGGPKFHQYQVEQEPSDTMSVFTRHRPKPGRMRFPFLKQQPGGAPQYTEANFKPMGDPLSTSDTTAATAVKGSSGTRVAPLSLMLEIYPMGEAGKIRESASTVHWDGRPVATLMPVMRKPPPSLLVQGDASVRRPVLASPFEAQAAMMGKPFRVPVLQGHIGAPNRAPAFGVTLSGLQGLQGIQGLQASGVPMPDSKHRMIIMLNFYPKKTITMPTRQRDVAAEALGKGGAALLTGGTFSQRRQSDDGTSSASDPEAPGEAPTVLAVDVAPLLRSLPRNIRRHLSAILQTYQRAAPKRAGGDDYVDDQDDEEDASRITDKEDDDEYLDDLDDVGERIGEKMSPTSSGSRSSTVDAEPSDEDEEEEEVDDDEQEEGRPPAKPPGLVQPPRTRGREGAGDVSRKQSYFDVQDDDYEADEQDPVRVRYQAVQEEKKGRKKTKKHANNNNKNAAGGGEEGERVPINHRLR